MTEDAAALAKQLKGFQTDAVSFVRKMFKVEPTKQQLQLLEAISKPGARVTVRSGHGTGKTTSEAWVALWHVICFPDSKCPCTAPTGHQLNDLLWPEISKWHAKMPEWFKLQVKITKDTVAVVGAEKEQFAVARTSRPENPEALQGFHATNLLFLVDEASGIADQIFEPMRGALSTTGARCLLAGNPTRLDGLFYRTHHALRESWNCLHFNGEESPMVGKDFVEEMRRDYGDDSDIYRVRVRGDFPRASISQLISEDLIDPAWARQLREDAYSHAPTVLGVDVAWEGDDCSCVFLRQGLRSKMLLIARGMDNMTLADRVMGFEEEHRAAATFIDVGWGTGVIDRMRQCGRRPVPVNFGSSARDDKRFHNKRAEMWVEMKEWLERGGALDPVDKLRDDLVGPQYFFTPTGKIALESKKDMKKRGLPSPDRADALALTFAANVAPAIPAAARKSGTVNNKYNLFPSRRK